MSPALINEYTLPPNDSFKIMESLCNESFSHPKIFLNDFPMDISIDNTIELDQSKNLHNTSFLSKFGYRTISVPLYKSHVKKDILNNTMCQNCADFNIDAKSWTYISDSSYLCKSHEDGYEFQQFDSMLEVSTCSSGFRGSSSSSSYKVRDTLDACHYRRMLSQSHLMEPSTPIKRTYSAKRLDNHTDDSIGTSRMSDSLYQLRKSTATALDLDEMEMMDDIKTSMRVVTSSPVYTNNRNMAQNNDGDYKTHDDDDDSVDLNNTLERINNILAKGGFETPSPTRMARRKRLMEQYVSDLLQRESSLRNSNAVVKKSITKKKLANFFPSSKRKTMKRTISVDESLKLMRKRL